MTTPREYWARYKLVKMYGGPKNREVVYYHKDDIARGVVTWITGWPGIAGPYVHEYHILRESRGRGYRAAYGGIR